MNLAMPTADQLLSALHGTDRGYPLTLTLAVHRFIQLIFDANPPMLPTWSSFEPGRERGHVRFWFGPAPALTIIVGFVPTPDAEIIADVGWIHYSSDAVWPHVVRSETYLSDGQSIESFVQTVVEHVRILYSTP